MFAGAGEEEFFSFKGRPRTSTPWADDYSKVTVLLIGALEFLGAARSSVAGHLVSCLRRDPAITEMSGS
jgi:hypothetical protein